jgi:hypothetical protein
MWIKRINQINDLKDLSPLFTQSTATRANNQNRTKEKIMQWVDSDLLAYLSHRSRLQYPV